MLYGGIVETEDIFELGAGFPIMVVSNLVVGGRQMSVLFHLHFFLCLLHVSHIQHR